MYNHTIWISGKKAGKEIRNTFNCTVVKVWYFLMYGKFLVDNVLVLRCVISQFKVNVLIKRGGSFEM